MAKDTRDKDKVLDDLSKFNKDGIVYGSGDAYQEQKVVKRLLREKENLGAEEVGVLEEAREGLVEAARKQDLRASGREKMGGSMFFDDDRSRLSEAFHPDIDKPNGQLDIVKLEIMSAFADIEAGMGVPDAPSNATNTLKTDRDYHGKGPRLRQPKS